MIKRSHESEKRTRIIRQMSGNRKRDVFVKLRDILQGPRQVRGKSLTPSNDGPYTYITLNIYLLMHTSKKIVK